MAAWRARGGEPARAQPKRRSAAKFAGLAVLLIALSAPSGAYSEGAVIYVNAPQGQLRAALGSDLRQSLASKLNYTLAEVDTDQAVMQRIAADPGSVGLVQRDQYVQYLRDHSDRQTRFEFYGNIHACLMVVVRKGSQIQTYGDLVRSRAERSTTLDVGPATGQLAATFANLRQMDGSLGHLALRNGGCAR